LYKTHCPLVVWRILLHNNATDESLLIWASDCCMFSSNGFDVRSPHLKNTLILDVPVHRIKDMSWLLWPIIDLIIIVWRKLPMLPHRRGVCIQYRLQILQGNAFMCSTKMGLAKICWPCLRDQHIAWLYVTYVFLDRFLKHQRCFKNQTFKLCEDECVHTYIHRCIPREYKHQERNPSSSASIPVWFASGITSLEGGLQKAQGRNWHSDSRIALWRGGLQHMAAIKHADSRTASLYIGGFKSTWPRLSSKTAQ